MKARPELYFTFNHGCLLEVSYFSLFFDKPILGLDPKPYFPKDETDEAMNGFVIITSYSIGQRSPG